MTVPNHNYVFEIHVASKDRSGYYIARWDEATIVTVIAANRGEALEKAYAVMGQSPSGGTWTARIKSIKPEAPS